MPRPECKDPVIIAVAREFKVYPDRMMGIGREPMHSHPRMIAMYLMRLLYLMTFEDIALRFNRHHTSVIHACKWVKNKGMFKYADRIQKLITELSK